ncbi:glycosyltransferase family 4 protein [Sphingomonas arvum]
MSAKRPSICFVTNELYPLGPGGIGRMLYNFARHNESLGFPADIHFLVPQLLLASRPDAREVLDEALEGLATVHVCPALRSVPSQLAQLLAKAEDYPWTSEWLYSDSYRYYLGLKLAQERLGAAFDVIEFPDFGGWGVASLEAKRAGLDFADTLISARVHSTQGILYGVERYAYDPGHWAGIMFDAERHLFANADLIVGHDPAIIDYTARSYALEERWHGRTVLEFPPIYIRTAPGTYVIADKVDKPGSDDSIDFLFGSRLQPVKRPDLFIRAAILYLENHPAYAGTFRLVCGGWDRAFVEMLKSLVPGGLSERIRFIEKANPDERQYYIERSIVVVPSDYESLCLFAFEAALAGRKVILNGTCPAFGNGYRWRDGGNCLLFDGTVESLAATMHNALTWRPATEIEVAPSMPYWLSEKMGEPEPAHPTSADIRIFCYGAQSTTEVHRQLDMAIALEEALKGAGRRCEITFQLPRGSFEPDGSEAKAIHQRGWAVVFSSGNRECPAMFGRRLAALGDGAVLLFPFGYEPSAAFVSNAFDVQASDPALALVGGHVELVDSATGRSDYLRVYSGEAPSTALLSSRIAPTLSVVNLNAVKRIGFDPLAGGLWFEVFARLCALNGERIAVLPMVAGTLDPFSQRKLETTKRISAGLLDQLGRAAGWQARLLSVDPVQVPSEADGTPLPLQPHQLRQVLRVHPARKERAWEPVGWQENAHGALVHPLDGEVTIAEIPGVYRRISGLTAHVRNMRNDNDGALVAVALARSQVSTDRILQVVQSGAHAEDVALSAWRRIEPGTALKIACPCYGVSKGNDKILLFSRVPDGKSEENAEIVFTGVDLHFNDQTIG